jgi:hypothetical protein
MVKINSHYIFLLKDFWRNPSMKVIVAKLEDSQGGEVGKVVWNGTGQKIVLQIEHR